MRTIARHRQSSLVLLFAAAVVAVAWAVWAPAKAQTSELSIVADKGGYTVGDVAVVRVSGLNECSGRTIRIGFRSVADGAALTANEVTLDASGNGSTRLTLTSDNAGVPVQAAAWADCVSRGLESGLALDPHPLLISISPSPQAPSTGSGRAPERWEPGIALVAGFLLICAAVAGVLVTTDRTHAKRG